MAGPLIVSAGCVAAGSGVPLLWVAWSKPRNQKRLPLLAGFLLILGGAALLGLTTGAWGYAIAATAASAVALLLLAVIALRATPTKRSTIREPLAHPLKLREMLLDLPRRFSIFLLVVPGGLIASTIFACGAWSAATHGGWAQADSTMLALGGMPMVWAILVGLQMTQSSLQMMVVPLTVTAILGALLGLLA